MILSSLMTTGENIQNNHEQMNKTNVLCRVNDTHKRIPSRIRRNGAMKNSEMLA